MFTSSYFRLPPLVTRSLPLILALCFLGIPALAQGEKSIPILEYGKPIEREIAGGQSQPYRIDLSVGQFVQIVVDQRGIDVTLVWSEPDGRMKLERDRPNGADGEESLSFIAPMAGGYRLVVKALEEKAAPGKYQIKINALRTPTAHDKQRIQAEAIFQEAVQLSQTTSEEAINQACEKYEAAVVLWMAVDDKYAEALTQTSLGYARQSLGKSQPAVVAHERALVLYRQLEDKVDEASTLIVLGRINDNLGNTRKSLEFYTDALALMRLMRNKAGEARALNNIGAVYDSLGSGRKALGYFFQALPLFRQAGDKSGEALTLNNIGHEYDAFGQKLKALAYYNQAVLQSRATNDKSAEATALHNVGLLYDSLGKKLKALSYFSRALPLWQDQTGRARTLTALGGVYDDLGDQHRALDCYNEALPLTQATADKAGEASVLHNIGNLFSSRGENQKALYYFNQAASLFKAVKNERGETTSLAEVAFLSALLGDKKKALQDLNGVLVRWRSLKDKHGEATTLNYLGNVYDDLGEEQQALTYYKQALLVFSAEARKQDEAKVLNNIGGAYDDLGDKQKALQYLNRALAIWRALRDRQGEGTTLNNIGRIYDDLKMNREAHNYLSEALTIARDVGNVRGEGRTLVGLGRVSNRLGERQKALEYLNQAAPLLNSIGDKAGEAAALSNVMIVWHDLKNLRLATFYGKQSVNTFQHLRSDIKGLDNETQKTFLRSVEDTYRYLADVLIEQGRFAETQQVLNSFKDQQYFDFNPETRDSPVQLAMTPREADLASRYDLISQKINEIAKQVEELKSTIGSKQPSAQESGRFHQLEAELKAAAVAFSSVIKQTETEFSGPPDPRKDKSTKVADTTELQSALRQVTDETGQSAVAVYAIIYETKFQALIVTSDEILAVSTPIKADAVSRKARELWLLLNAPDYDPRMLSSDLYEAVFKPIEDKIPKDTGTIIWSLDGNLRYLPMAALYDGKQYLVEKYNHVSFTRADSGRLTREASRTLTGYGFATTQPHKVELHGESFEFPPNDFAKDELQVFRTKSNAEGIIDGEVYFESEFSKSNFLKTLKQKRPLVHISSHFSFQPGNASNSFLLLGDDNIWTLSEMKDEPNLFQDVQLLTLSACDTAAQRPDANGKEVDAFAELAQRLGAAGVMASLWPVLDRSTADLMKAFYENRQDGRYSKAEALRQAQLDMLYGRNPTMRTPAQGQPRIDRSKGHAVSDAEKSVELKYRVPFKVDPKKRFAHPYYWAPFVLFGNWK